MEFTNHELGPAIIFQHFPDAIRLDHYLIQQKDHITDDLRPANSGQWTLTVQSGQGSLVRTGRPDAPGHPAAPPGRTPPAPSSPNQPSLPPGSPERNPLALGPRGLAALYAGTPVATLRRAGLAAGGDPASDAALDGAFAANPFMLDGF